MLTRWPKALSTRDCALRTRPGGIAAHAGGDPRLAELDLLVRAIPALVSVRERPE